MAISAILLCFVGVWASQTALNLKFTGIVNPDILCKIEVKSTSSETFTTLFDNSGTGKAEDYLDTQNRLKNFTTTLDGTVATGLDFKLTNYTPTKHIRLTIKNILIDGENLTLENLSANHTSASAEKMGLAPNTGEFTLALSASQNDTFKVSLNLLVEEVYMVSTSGVGLANPGKFFFAETETPEIPLLASVSYQLPQSVIFNKLVDETLTPMTSGTAYARTNNTEGEATFDNTNLQENVSIICDCDRVFLVEKNLNPSLFENGQQTSQGFIAAFDNTKTYMPNNGKYSYSADFGQVTKGEGFKEYPYYITLGEYPQSKVSNEMASTLNMKLSSGQLTRKTEYTQNITISTEEVVQNTITWYEFDGEKYVKTKSVVYGDKNTTTQTDAEGQTSIIISQNVDDVAWFKVEPISWVVLAAEKPNGQTIDLGTLYYSETNKMFYQDQLCGKPFAGKLLLMSAYALDASEFNPTGLTFANFAGSQLQTFLANSIGSAYTLNGNSSLDNMQSSYITLSSLATYTQTGFGSFSRNSVDSALFLLAASQLNSDEDQNNNETYHASDYFSGAPEKDKSIFTSSLASTSPTDYAIAHYAETSTSQSTSNDANAYNNPDNFASPRGWAVGETSATTATCTYWTRSAHNTPNSTMAKVINTRGAIKATDITDPQITVRPCMVLDIGFYYNGTFNYSS